MYWRQRHRRVNRVFTIGGTQAIAALIYGTASVRRVDKIVGPGNAYVATAKRRVFGTVGINIIAGPSEILVICDGQTDPDRIAIGLFSQAEHGEDSKAILISADPSVPGQLQSAMERRLPSVERRETIRRALMGQSVPKHVRDLAEAVQVANVIAPEHLELSVAEPEKIAREIKRAGAIFSAATRPRPWAITAPSPTTCCRLRQPPASPLPWAFTTSKNAPVSLAARLGRVASVLAQGESLTAHAYSAEYRIQGAEGEEPTSGKIGA